MNKKFIYSLVLTSIFLMSTLAVCLQPAAAANWKFGVPKEAIGMKLQSEVTAYDKDLWGDCIGLNPDDRASLATGSYREGFSSDGDNVGARAQSEINDWESQDFWFMGDSLLWTWMDESVRLNPALDRTGDGKSDLQTYWDGVTFARNTILGLAGNTYTGEITASSMYYKPLIQAMWSIVNGSKQSALGALITNTLSTVMNNTEGLGNGGIPTGAGAWASTFSRADVTSFFHKTYEAKVLERDVWYWDKEADFGSDPDETDAVSPFIVNPEDLYDSWVYFFTMIETLLAQAEAIAEAMDTFIYLTNYSVNLGGQWTWQPYPAFTHAWNFLNYTLYNKIALYALVDPTYAQLKAKIDATYPLGFSHDAVFGWYYVVTSALRDSLIKFFRSKIPDRAEYLLILLKAGIPAHQPVDKWLEKMIDEFSIDKDTYYNAADDPFKLDVSVDGLVVTADIEWATGVKIDDSKPWSEDENQREDYTIVFTYSDTGAQSTKEYNRDGDIFYKSESIAPTIPGYEVSILLGAGAIATLGLIYVVIKKRRM